MARSPNEKAEKARKLYKDGMRLVEIADQLKVPAGTVRRWKSTYHWDGKHQSERSEKKSERSESKKSVTKKAVADEVKQVIQNTDLTDKQQLFVYITFAASMLQKHIKKHMAAIMQRLW